MIDHESFEAAIAAAPDDDTRRLVFADYLAEQGDTAGEFEQRWAVVLRAILAEPDNDDHRENAAVLCERYGRAERAEFVRVQVELAKQYRVYAADLTSGYEALEDRCKELWGWWPDTDKICSQFHATMPALPDGRGWMILPEQWVRDWHYTDTPLAVVRRGFISEVRLPVADWLRVERSLAWGRWPCGRCEGTGVGSWTHNGFTEDACPVCGISGVVGPTDECMVCKWCGKPQPPEPRAVNLDFLCPCGGEWCLGRVPRPIPGTAQPLERVALTSLPTAHVPEFNALRRWVKPLEWGGDVRDSIRAEWPWVTFEFPATEIELLYGDGSPVPRGVLHVAIDSDGPCVVCRADDAKGLMSISGRSFRLCRNRECAKILRQRRRAIEHGATRVPCSRCAAPNATFGPDPYDDQINGDDAPRWMCDGCRQQSAANI